MDDTEQYIHALSKDTDILEDLTYLGIVVKNRERSVHEPFQQIGSVHDVIDSLSTNIRRCQYLCRGSGFEPSCHLCSMFYCLDVRYGQTPNKGLEGAHRSLGIKCIHIIKEYFWLDNIRYIRIKSAVDE